MILAISGMSMCFLLPIILTCVLLLIALYKGPTSVDRVLTFSVFGVMVVSFAAFAAVIFQRRFLMDIALSWVLLGFISIIALAKYLDGRNLDE